VPVIDIDTCPVVEGSRYPSPHDEPCRKKHTRILGQAADLTQFGVNLVRLEPGAWSSQRHWHEHEDEFVMQAGRRCRPATVRASKPAFAMATILSMRVKPMLCCLLQAHAMTGIMASTRISICASALAAIPAPAVIMKPKTAQRFSDHYIP